MKFRKIISQILAIVMLISFSAVPAFAAQSDEAEEAVKTVDYICEDFEGENDDTSDWEFRAITAGGSYGEKKAVIVEEDGNKFMRVSYNGDHQNGPGRMATLSKKFSDGAFDMPDDGVTVIEFRTRMNAKNLARLFKFNYPTSDDIPNNEYNEYGHYTRIVAYFNTQEGNQTVNYTYKNYGGSNKMQGSGTKIADEWSTDVWYTIKMVLDFQSEKMYFVLDCDDYETPLKSGAVPMDAWWFKYHDYEREYPIEDQLLEDFTIQFKNDVDVENEYVDFDDFKVYAQKDEVSAAVIPNTEFDMVYLPEELSFKFDALVDMEDGAVTVVDENGNTVSHEGSFDQKTFTYTARFENPLQAGGYSFVLDPDKAKPVNSSEGIFDSMTFESEEIPFTVYDILPPVAEDVTITGRVIAGTAISGDYTYICEEEKSSAAYEWYAADSAEAEEDEWELIDAENSAELEVGEELEGKYIKMAVTPVSVSGLTGEKEFSNIIAPERAPETSNRKLSTSVLFTNAYVSAEYDYYDENGDEEAGSEIDWYVSDNGTNGWEKVSTGKYFRITDEYNGKYIKYTVIPCNDAPRCSSGTLAESEAFGPVEDMLEATNLFKNPGFEDGVIEPWDYNKKTEGYKGIEITQDDVYSGEYAIFAHPRLSSTCQYHQKVRLIGGRTYIISAMLKSADGKSYSSWECYAEGQGGGSTTKPYRSIELATLEPEWMRISNTYSVNSTADYTMGFIAFQNLGSTAYIDDHYVGELLISDIEATALEPVTVPKDSTLEVPFQVGRVLNQLGDETGLTEQTVEMYIHPDSGVTYNSKTQKLVVDSTATAGTVEIELTCTPTYQGAAQQRFVKIVELELLAHDDAAPRVLSVSAAGTVAVGSTLKGEYEFYQVENKENDSTVRWVYSESANGVYYDIPGATSSEYVVESAYADKYIKFAVTPKTADGMTGENAFSDYLTMDKAPAAHSLTVSGNFNVGGTIVGDYTFKDENKDSEGTSTFKWYISDSKDGSYTEMTGMTSKELVLDENMTGKYIKFGVTPVAAAEPYAGTEVLSQAYMGPSVPVADNIEIKNNNGRLVAAYRYYHPHNARELDSIYEWMIDGSVVSTEASYTINFTGRKNVTFSVTPVADSNPSTGEKVSFTKEVQGSSSGYDGGTSGSYGGRPSGGTTNVVVTPKPTVTDIDGHWGAEAIKAIAALGIIAPDGNGNYNPDKAVAREEMLTYLFKALKLEKTEYSGMFSDVADGGFAQMLQTMVNNGTISVDTMFRPGDCITREEMCKILYISLKNAGKLETANEDLISNLADYSDISDWAKEYVNTMYCINIIKGISDTEFAPKQNVTRAQAATMLTRVLSIMEGESK